MKTPRDAINSQYCVQNSAGDYEGILKSALKVLAEQQLDTKFEKSKEVIIPYEYSTTSVLDYGTPIFSEHLKWLYDEIQLTQDKIFEQATLNILVDREISFNGNNYLKIGDQMKDKSGNGFDLEVKQTENCPKGTQLIHDERTVRTTKQYLIDEFNKHFNEFIVYDTASPSFYDYKTYVYEMGKRFRIQQNCITRRTKRSL
jgi:hypothetical protein